MKAHPKASARAKRLKAFLDKAYETKELPVIATLETGAVVNYKDEDWFVCQNKDDIPIGNFYIVGLIPEDEYLYIFGKLPERIKAAPGEYLF